MKLSFKQLKDRYGKENVKFCCSFIAKGVIYENGKAIGIFKQDIKSFKMLTQTDENLVLDVEMISNEDLIKDQLDNWTRSQETIDAMPSFSDLKQV